MSFIKKHIIRIFTFVFIFIPNCEQYLIDEIVEPSYNISFKCDQSVLTPVTFQAISMNAADKEITIHWGDGETVDFYSNVKTEITHDYIETGIYQIYFTGDVDWIGRLDVYSQSILADTDVSKWTFPAYLKFAHLYSNEFIGDITDMQYPSSCQGIHMKGNYLTADITDWEFPNTYWDIHIGSLIDGGITGDISAWKLPDNIAHFNVEGDVTGDLTDVIPWVNTTYGTVMLGLIGGNFYGDLSGWTIPDKKASLTAQVGCNFTKLPRGHFRNVVRYRFQDNSCSSGEIDSLLVYIDNYFTDGIVPLTDCEYRLFGDAMGAPSVIGLTSIETIKSKYIDAGFIATIHITEES